MPTGDSLWELLASCAASHDRQKNTAAIVNASKAQATAAKGGGKGKGKKSKGTYY